MPEDPPVLPVAVARPRLVRVSWILFTVAVLASSIALAVSFYAVHQSGEAAHAKAQSRVLYRQATSAGLQPSATPAGASPASTSAPTSAGVTDVQVLRDVRLVCTQTPALCQQPVSIPTLVDAVRTCFAAADCPAPPSGKPGTPGRSGAPGSSGQPGPSGHPGASGAAAPPVTDTQIITELATYCDQQANHCTGPAGSTGPPGPPGASGASGANGKDGVSAPVVTSIDCSGPLLTNGLVFTFHYSDGNSLAVTCSAKPVPSPTPS